MKKNISQQRICLWALLTGLVLLAVRILSVHDVHGPVVYGDEFIYWKNMMALFASQGSVNSGYPPLYSGWMAIGMLWPDTYRGVLLLNVLAGAVLPFAAWRISGHLSGPSRIMSVVLLSVMPVLWVYPRMMMSENLFLPLLVLIFLAIHAQFRSKAIWPALLAGVFLWLASMTRYQGVIFIIAAVLSMAVTLLWWYRDAGNPRPEKDRGRHRIAGLFLVGGIPAAGILLWKWVGVSGSWEFGQTTSYIYRHGIQLTPGLLLMWVTFYLSYLVLCILPVLPALLHGGWRVLTAKKKDPSSLAVMLFLVFSTGASLLAAARHSALVEYNHPDPSHIMGRYLIFVPALSLLCLLVFPYLRETLNCQSRRVYLGIWSGCAVLGILAYGVVAGGWFYTIPSWFLMTHTGLGAFFYKSHIVVAVSAILIGLLVFLPNRVLYLTALAVFLSAASFTGRSDHFNNGDGPEAFTAILEDTLQEHENSLVGTSSRGWFKDLHAGYYLKFKGMDMQRVRIGEGFENPNVAAVVRIEPAAGSGERPLFVADDGMAVYVDTREEELPD